MSPFHPSFAPMWAASRTFDFMLFRHLSTLRNLAVLTALILVGRLAVYADDTPAAPPVGNPLPASGAQKEPGGDQPKPTGSPTAAPNSPAEVRAPAGSDTDSAAPKQMVVRAERDYEIERTVGSLLENHHYLQRPIDAEISRRWLGLYLAALDESHRFFLQSDIDEFTHKYADTTGNTLGDLLHGDDESAAVNPAFEIFQRFLQRLRTDVTLAQKLVHEKHDFTKRRELHAADRQVAVAQGRSCLGVTLARLCEV